MALLYVNHSLGNITSCPNLVETKQGHRLERDLLHKDHRHDNQRLYRQVGREEAPHREALDNYEKAESADHGTFCGEIQIKFNRRYLPYCEVFDPKPVQIAQAKKSTSHKKKGKYIPPPDHPWKRHNPALHHNCYLERAI
jgi:hypothetical protein